MKTIKLTLLLILPFINACSTTPTLPDKVMYNCSFDIATYYPDAPTREIDRLTDLLVWINQRVKGRFPVGHSISLSHDVEKRVASTTAVLGDRERRMIWLLPSEMMKGKTPISAMIDLRGDKYILTKINEEDRPALGFRLPEYLDADNPYRMIYEFRNLGYCDRPS